MSKAQFKAQGLSKSEKREKLFFMSHSKNNVVLMPLNGHWNNDSGCRLDEKD